MIATAAQPCATRGCNGLAPPRFTRCADCLTGGPQRRKLSALLAAVEGLPPLLPGPNAFGCRVPGSPMSWNNALIRTRGRPFLSERAREWKKCIAFCASAALPATWSRSGRFAVEIHSVFARALADADGPIKLALDALQGVAFDNDRQVSRVSATKDVGPIQRLEVIVRAVPTEGKEH